jgi:hypothetical protein
VLIARLAFLEFGSGIMQMSYFDVPGHVLREFIIRRDRSGRWLVAGTSNPASVCAFHSQDAAELYALREAEGDYDRVHFLPSQM